MMRPKYKTIICVLIVVIFIVSALVIDDYNKYILNTTNSDYAGLSNVLSGFFGAIIGGLLSLLGIAWTIEFTSQQNKKDRELQIRPYFDIRCSKMLRNHADDHLLGFIRLFIEGKESYNEIKTGCTKLVLNNVGLGTAINLEFHVSVDCDWAKHNEWFTNGNLLVDANAIAAGDSGIVYIQLYNKVAEITDEDRCWSDNLKTDSYEKTLHKLPAGFSFNVIIEYQDLLTNWFTQKLDYTVQYVLDNDKICGNIILQNVHPAVKKEENNN